jgi:hypothetical protein
VPPHQPFDSFDCSDGKLSIPPRTALRLQQTMGTGRNTPPVEETEHDGLLTPIRNESDDDNVDKGDNDASNDHSDGNDDDREEVDDDEDDDNEGTGDNNDENVESDYDEDEEYGDDDDDENVEEASDAQEATWDDDEGRAADLQGTAAWFSQKSTEITKRE